MQNNQKSGKPQIWTPMGDYIFGRVWVT